MKIFLNAPEFRFRVFGSILPPIAWRWIVRIGALLSVSAILAPVASVLVWNGDDERLGGAVVLVVMAWIVVQGVMRLFVTGFMGLVDYLSEALGNADDRLVKPLRCLFIAHWLVLDLFLVIAFSWCLILALLISLGVIDMSG